VQSKPERGKCKNLRYAIIHWVGRK